MGCVSPCAVLPLWNDASGHSVEAEIHQSLSVQRLEGFSSWISLACLRYKIGKGFSCVNWVKTALSSELLRDSAIGINARVCIKVV